MQSGPFDGARLYQLTTSLPDAVVPYYSGLYAQGRIVRLDLHRLPEAQFGAHGSKQRLYTVTNSVSHVLLMLSDLSEGVAAYPSMKQLHSSNSRLYLFLSQDAAAALDYSAHFPVGPQDLQQQMINSCINRYHQGLPGRLLTDGTVVGVAVPVQEDGVVATVRFREYMQQAAGSGDYKHPWPGDAVVKLRNLPSPFHKPGVLTAVLQAAGYDAAVRVTDHYRDASTAFGDSIVGLPDRKVLCAVVQAPVDDPTFSRVPRSMQWPGVPGRVKFSVQLSQVVPVGNSSRVAGDRYITQK